MSETTANKTDLLVLLAKGAALLLGAAAFFFGFVVIKSIYDFLAFGPEKGATGVFMIDSMFGGFAVLIMSRFLWIYAVKRERRAAEENES